MYLQSHIYKNIPVSFDFITTWNEGVFLCSPCIFTSFVWLALPIFMIVCSTTGMAHLKDTLAPSCSWSSCLLRLLDPAVLSCEHLVSRCSMVSRCSNIEELALFPGQKSARVLSYGGKQLISREVELERMRRTEARLQAGTNVTKEKPCSKMVVPNHLQKLQPKNVSSEVVSAFLLELFQ